MPWNSSHIRITAAVDRLVQETHIPVNPQIYLLPVRNAVRDTEDVVRNGTVLFSLFEVCTRW